VKRGDRHSFVLKHLDLFSGIGGFALAAKWVGFETVGFSEIDPFCNEVLAYRFPNIPNYGDCRYIKTEEIGNVDIVTGGFPCQPFSVAGERRGDCDERFLWPECVRILRELRPRFAIFENVPGLLTIDSGRTFNRVLSDLSALRYDCLWNCIPACAVGAPHRRDRVWIVAVAQSIRDSSAGNGRNDSKYHSTARELRGRSLCTLGNSNGKRLQRQREHSELPRELFAWKDGEIQRGQDGKQRLCKPRLPLVANGISRAMERIKSSGNAILPQIAYVLMNGIKTRCLSPDVNEAQCVQEKTLNP
jgi:DNA (cytosine-5)-methyltransferase 1